MKKLTRLDRCNYITFDKIKVNVGIIKKGKFETGLYVQRVRKRKQGKDTPTLVNLTVRTFDTLYYYCAGGSFGYIQTKTELVQILGVGECLKRKYSLTEKGKRRHKILSNRYKN